MLSLGLGVGLGVGRREVQWEWPPARRKKFMFMGEWHVLCVSASFPGASRSSVAEECKAQVCSGQGVRECSVRVAGGQGVTLDPPPYRCP